MVKQRADDEQNGGYGDKDHQANDAAAVTRTRGGGWRGIEHHEVV